MSLATLLTQLRPTGLDAIAFPRHLLGAFRRKSITFSTGVTDETAVVYWFQSRSFTIDLRLPDAAATPAAERQGWVGDTLWDEKARHLSWRIGKSYQPHNQWPEPAALHFIGNCVLEFAPSGAYVEDWRQQSSRGTFLGLRLLSMRNEATGDETAMDGGLVIAGEHGACVQSRHPQADERLHGFSRLEDALGEGTATEADIESYEVSVAIDGQRIAHSTQPYRLGDHIAPGIFSIRPDGLVTERRALCGDPCVLLYQVDLFEPDYIFGNHTDTSEEALEWMEREKRHLARHAVIAR